MKIRFSFDIHSIEARLYANPTARDFFALMPLQLTLQDYWVNEKIAYLPRKLTERGARPFADEAPGDLCYYAPWGNLVMFYAAYRYSTGLIRLGRLEGWQEPLSSRGTFPLIAEIHP